ncbi:MAG: protein-L-isoaspartate O-methyltransferase, partial [Anaerolineales bacterium]|nr:protein-L-isoaspartate O-methyltransferase [Anaerolineales bacterium]
MVREQLAGRGIADETVLRAMAAVPRQRFVHTRFSGLAYEDSPLPIQQGQTISQPYVVARMAELLELRTTDRVLDVGTGSGYAAAVLSRIVAEVYGIERHAQLAETAARALAALDY